MAGVVGDHLRGGGGRGGQAKACYIKHYCHIQQAKDHVYVIIQITLRKGHRGTVCLPPPTEQPMLTLYTATVLY